MKRYILFLTLAVFGISGCKKESLSTFDIEKSFEDPNVRYEDFKKVIADGTDGFKVLIEPTTSGNLIGGYIKFESATNSKIVLDNTLQNAATPVDNGYTIKVSQTNTVLGLGGSSPFSITARAISGVDTTYSYKYTVGDTIKMVGDLLGTKMSLIKVVKADGDAYLAGKMAEIVGHVNDIMLFPRYFKRITVGTKSYDVSFNTNNKKVIFNYSDGSVYKTFSSEYAYSNSGIEFKRPFIDGNVTIPSLSELVINTSAHSATLTAGTTTATLTNELTPAAIDLTAASTFLTSPFKGDWSESYTGFTIAGVEDALGVTSIPNFFSIDLYPGDEDNYSTLQFWLTSSYYSLTPAGAAYASEDGKLHFGFLGYLGSSTSTATSNVVVATARIFAQTEGFYVVPATGSAGGPAYDLVNARDATSWITFE
ncbi:DUF4302 domain-containing protein [Pedobacter sp. AW31-3R]|uniref:DUF4302 domain-containing protein n=1 Tax=Pedobacter sp. AW31-3R TaxID=3445781 RepID=UPI003FA0FB78